MSVICVGVVNGDKAHSSILAFITCGPGSREVMAVAVLRPWMGRRYTVLFPRQ